MNYTHEALIGSAVMVNLVPPKLVPLGPVKMVLGTNFNTPRTVFTGKIGPPSENLVPLMIITHKVVNILHSDRWGVPLYDSYVIHSKYIEW